MILYSIAIFAACGFALGRDQPTGRVRRSFPCDRVSNRSLTRDRGRQRIARDREECGSKNVSGIFWRGPGTLVTDQTGRCFVTMLAVAHLVRVVSDGWVGRP